MSLPGRLVFAQSQKKCVSPHLTFFLKKESNKKTYRQLNKINQNTRNADQATENMLGISLSSGGQPREKSIEMIVIKENI